MGRFFGPVGVPAGEEPGAVGPLAASGEAPTVTGGADGGSAATVLSWLGTLGLGTLGLGPEEPQPAASARARTKAATATAAAYVRCRGPDIRRLWTWEVPYPASRYPLSYETAGVRVARSPTPLRADGGVARPWS